MPSISISISDTGLSFELVHLIQRFLFSVDNAEVLNCHFLLISFSSILSTWSIHSLYLLDPFKVLNETLVSIIGNFVSEQNDLLFISMKKRQCDS